MTNKNYKTKTFEIPYYILASDIERLIKIGNGEILYNELAFKTEIPGAPQITIRALEKDFNNLKKALEVLATS